MCLLFLTSGVTLELPASEINLIKLPGSIDLNPILNAFRALCSLLSPCAAHWRKRGPTQSCQLTLDKKPAPLQAHWECSLAEMDSDPPSPPPAHQPHGSLLMPFFYSALFLSFFSPLKFLFPASGWNSYPPSCSPPGVQCSLTNLSRLSLVPLTHTALIKGCHGLSCDGQPCIITYCCHAKYLLLSY